MTKYAVVTTIQTFVHKYVIPMDELQSLNTEVPVELEWANDCVTCQEVEEFTQRHIGEQIINTEEMTEDQVVDLYRKELEWPDMPKERILKATKDWKASR